MVGNETMEPLDLAELTQAPAQGELQELTEAPAPVGFLDKPFDEYTATEGLLLVIVVLLVLLLLSFWWRSCTSWL